MVGLTSLFFGIFNVISLTSAFMHCCDVTYSKSTLSMSSGTLITDPLLLRAARGEEIERVPVWMMRQAGRHMKSYRELCKKAKTFRERSENSELATEIRSDQLSYLAIIYV